MKKIIAVSLVILLTVLAIGCDKKEQPAAIGEVNGSEISQNEYDKRKGLLLASFKAQQEAYGLSVEDEIPDELNKQIEEQAFQDLVNIKLLLAEADEKNIKITDKDVNDSVEAFKQNISAAGENALEDFLKDMGMNEKELKSQIQNELIISKLQQEIIKDVKVSDQEAQAYYEENQQFFAQPAGIQISHILIDSEEKANQIIKELQAGADFAELAKKNSSDGSASLGGDLGIVNENTGFVPEFLDAALELEPGQITEKPVKSEFGYHIIKAGDRQEASISPFDTVKGDILSQLQQENEAQVFSDFIEELRNKADIKDYRDKEKDSGDKVQENGQQADENKQGSNS